jgi:Zn-dependent metalloprotease
MRRELDLVSRFQFAAITPDAAAGPEGRHPLRAVASSLPTDQETNSMSRDATAQHRVRTRKADLARGPLVAALLATAGLSIAAQAEGKERPAWTRSAEVNISRSDLGLPARVAPPRLARAALGRVAGRLGLRESLAGLRLAGEQRVPAANGARELRLLRFRQTVGGLRLVWSQIDVTIGAGRVRSIGATVVPARPGPPVGRQRVSRSEALAIARRAVAGADQALRPLPAAYAGNPTTRAVRPRVPRRVWVVEVSPAARGEDESAAWCIIVDAETGKVIARWEGMAARPGTGAAARGRGAAVATSAGRPTARASAIQDLMVEVYDATQPGVPNYADFELTGPRNAFSSWPTLDQARFLRPRTAVMDRVAANARNAAGTVCVVRFYCGKSGLPVGPVANPAWQVRGNDPASISSANRSTLGVTLSHRHVMGLGDFNDVLAHEFGHVRDWVAAGDRFAGGSSFGALEVEEAIADMFAYDYDRKDAAIGENGAFGAFRDWANPGRLPAAGQPHPSHLDFYDPSPPRGDPHFNSTILSHGYFRFVQKVGHDRAGQVLKSVPPGLSPRPTMSEFVNQIVAAARVQYPQDGTDRDAVSDVAQATDAAFKEAGFRCSGLTRCKGRVVLPGT